MGSKVGKGSDVGSPGKDRLIRSGSLTPRRLEKFEQHFKRRAKIRLSSQRMQARSPQQKCLHGGQIKKQVTPSIEQKIKDKCQELMIHCKRGNWELCLEV